MVTKKKRKKNKGRVVKVFSVSYKWDCPHCECGHKSKSLEEVQLMKKIHRCEGRTEEDKL